MRLVDLLITSTSSLSTCLPLFSLVCLRSLQVVIGDKVVLTAVSGGQPLHVSKESLPDHEDCQEVQEESERKKIGRDQYTRTDKQTQSKRGIERCFLFDVWFDWCMHLASFFFVVFRSMRTQPPPAGRYSCSWNTRKTRRISSEA